MSDFYKNLDVGFEIPENLGAIEFLRKHPLILQKLVEYSSHKSLKPFIIAQNSGEGSGGMTWNETPEGYSFWNNILIHKNTKIFYERFL